MKIPSDPLEAVIAGLNLAIEAFAIPDAYNRLRTGIAAKAEKEGRDVTPDEEQILDGLLEASKKERDGK